jgi:hypothetical protein
MADVMISARQWFRVGAMDPTEIAARLRPHHQRAFERYLVAERALVIAGALDALDDTLTATRDAARRVAAGYAELIVKATASTDR